MIQARGQRRGLWAAIALLAVALKVMAPPGFMVAPAHTGAAIVICTGHGPVALGGGHAAPKRNAPACPFAGNGVAPPLQTAPTVLIVPVDYVLAGPGNSLAAAAAPSLAAPPPPSQAPPVSL